MRCVVGKALHEFSKAGLLGLGLCIGIGTVGAPQPAAARDLTVVGGSTGGAYYQVAAAFAEIVKAEIPGTNTTVIPGGGWANVERLAPDSKLADVGVVENVLTTLAMKGESPTKKKYDLRMLASVRGPSIAQAGIVARTGIKTFEDIKTKKYPIRIGTFERAQLVTPMALDILAGYGLTEKVIQSYGGRIVFGSINQGIQMIMDGRADMWLTGGSVFPQPRFIEIGTKEPFRLLPISKEVATSVAKKYGADVVQVPAGAYDKANGTYETYWSPKLIITLAVRTDLPDELVYQMTAALAKRKERFWAVHAQHKFYDPKVAWQNVGEAPLHPGAAKWYREQGYMK
jgi:TRAP transporter TAXI family solute receptor